MMKIVKPYGRTVTKQTGDQVERQLVEYRDAGRSHAVPDFVVADPKIVIAQWVQVIDKIATKPFTGGAPTSRQRAFRHALAEAALQVLINRDRLPDPNNRKKRLIKQWWRRVHPYGELTDDRVSRDPRGRWYETFANHSDVLQNDFCQMAEQIDRHLYHAECRISQGLPEKRKGKIQARAESITRSTVGPIAHRKTELWSRDDEAYYSRSGSLPAQIARVLGERADKGQRLNRVPVGEALYQHYGVVFRGEDGDVLSIPEAQSICPGRLALHDAIKRYYRTRLSGRVSNLRASLPTNWEQLFRRVNGQALNHDTNALIRTGRIIHYHSRHAQEDSPASLLQHWPRDLSQSPYWASEGQCAIKRNEAFVRVWRTSIAAATRTIRQWLDPEGQINGDLLGEQQSRQALANLSEVAFDQHAKLLFGEGAAPLLNISVGEKRSFLEGILQAVRLLRHGSFHFKGLKGFVDALKIAPANPSPMVEALWSNQTRLLEGRLATTLRTAHAEYFLTHAQAHALCKAIRFPRSTIALPRFVKILVRADQAWFGKFKLDLPRPANNSARQNPRTQCELVCTKLLFYTGFGRWLETQSSEALDGYLQKAITRANNEARKITGDDAMNARVNGLIRWSPGESIDQFSDRLSGLVAIEHRTQRGFTNDPAVARRNSAYIENLRCDIVAQAFNAYLKESGFEFLQKLSDEPAPAPLFDTAVFEQGPVVLQAEPWVMTLGLACHLMPVEVVNHLAHQIRKSQVLETNIADLSLVLDVLNRYIATHDLVQETIDYSHPSLASFYTQEAQAELPSVKSNRGPRELMRFGDLRVVKNAYAAQPISLEEIQVLASLSSMSQTQKRRETLHQQWAKNGRKLSGHDKAAYQRDLAAITEHRHLRNHVDLTDHLRLYRLILRVLGRLVDYSGLFERDLYFVFLATLHNNGLSPAEVFTDQRRQALFSTGQIINAIRTLSDHAQAAIFDEAIQVHFGVHIFRRGDRLIRIRNNFAHFNMLHPNQRSIDLTKSVNDARRLMSYDRKLKNSITGSIKDILKADGLDLSWSQQHGRVGSPSIRSVEIVHLRDAGIKEAACSPMYVRAVNEVFGGSDP